jgi:hypothetical protein
MEQGGYLQPHSCKRCQQILVDLSKQPVSNRLKPLHKRIEAWPAKAKRDVPTSFFGSHELASTLTGEPSFVKPFNIGPIKVGRENARRLLVLYEKAAWVATGCPSINQRVTRAFSKDAREAKQAEWQLWAIACYSISRKQLDEGAASGCLFFQALAQGILGSLADAPLQDPEFVLACKILTNDEIEFGLVKFRTRPRGIDTSPLYKANMIFDTGT